MYKLKLPNTDPRSALQRCHVRMAYLMLMTSAASVMMCYGNNSTSFKPIRKNSLMPIDFRPHYTQLYQVEKLKAQILRGLNLTSVPEPQTKKPSQPVRILNRLPVRAKQYHQPLSAIVWSEPVDIKRKKMADRLLFRVSNQRQKSASINRVSLVLRLRSNKHSKRKLRKTPKPRKDRQKLPDLKGKGIQNDQQNHASKKQLKSLRKKKSRSRRRRRKSRRVKVLVQTMSNKSGKFKRVAVQRIVVDRKFHWVKLPIPVSLVSRAVESSNQSLVLRLRCKRCHKGGVSIDSAVPRKKSRMKPVESAKDHVLNPNRPYLVIFAARSLRSGASPSRSARHVEGLCPHPIENSTSCCAERIHVTFKDLGWDHWIVHPEGFTTTVCRGVCQESGIGKTPSDDQRISSRGQKEASNNGRLSPSEHQLWFLRRNRNRDIVSVRESRDGRQAVSCQPQDRSSLDVMYYSDQNTLTRAVIPDLLANSCSCVKK